MPTPKLIVVAGLPCVGKSTIADLLAEALRLPLFSVDPIESAIIRSGFRRCFQTGLAAYLVAQTLAAEQLRLGTSVIVDAVSPVQEARDMWHNLADTYHVPLLIIECVCSDLDVHQERVQSRVRHIPGIPEVTWEGGEMIKKEYRPWTEPRLILDTVNPPVYNMQKSLEYINSFR